MTILLIYALIAYLFFRLIEFGLVRAWRAWRDRARREQVIVFQADEARRPPRPPARH